MEQCKAERTKSWPTLPRKKKMECLNVLNDLAISATDAMVIYSVGIYSQTKKDGPVRTSCKRTCNKSRESGRFVHWLDTKITSQTRSIVRCWKKLHHDERSIGGTQFQGSEITFNFFVKQIFNSYWKSKFKKRTLPIRWFSKSPLECWSGQISSTCIFCTYWHKSIHCESGLCLQRLIFARGILKQQYFSLPCLLLEWKASSSLIPTEIRSRIAPPH